MDFAKRDILVERNEIPPFDTGSPMPVLFADERNVTLAYRAALSDTDDVVCLKFIHCSGHYLGMPNEEALAGHPLYRSGLRPYLIVEVKNSSWIRSMERMNSVHPQHDAARYNSKKHFAIAFHDSLFQCVAKTFEIYVDRTGCESTQVALLKYLTRT